MLCVSGAFVWTELKLCPYGNAGTFSLDCSCFFEALPIFGGDAELAPEDLVVVFAD